jgi:Sulfotransferase family
MTSPGAAGIDPARLVFVAGLHRSGTTPLARLLGAHPQVSGFTGTSAKEDEGQHLQDVYPAARTYGGAGRFAFDPRAHLTETSPLVNPANAERLLTSWSPHWDLGRPVLLEKSPPNLLMTRMLQALFPGSRFVVIVRHPVVVALSTHKWVRKRRLSTPFSHWFTAHDLFSSDAMHLQHVHVVKYERLLTQPRVELDAIGTFLGLDSPISSDGLEGGRSSGYASRWAELAHDRAPWRRWERAALVRRYRDRATYYGYDLEDLDAIGPWPAA